jgi:membrane fusion protein (multidrug efflux system)
VFRGRITAIDSRIDPATRSIAVRADSAECRRGAASRLVHDGHGAWRTTVDVAAARRSVGAEQGRDYVFVVVDGKAIRKELKLGGREPGRVAIITGLADTDDVIVEGTQRVRSGGKVIAKPRS